MGDEGITGVAGYHKYLFPELHVPGFLESSDILELLSALAPGEHYLGLSTLPAKGLGFEWLVIALTEHPRTFLCHLNLPGNSFTKESLRL
jgi:hypothetical protein